MRTQRTKRTEPKSYFVYFSIIMCLSAEKSFNFYHFWILTLAVLLIRDVSTFNLTDLESSEISQMFSRRQSHNFLDDNRESYNTYVRTTNLMGIFHYSKGLFTAMCKKTQLIFQAQTHQFYQSVSVEIRMTSQWGFFGQCIFLLKKNAAFFYRSL